MHADRNAEHRGERDEVGSDVSVGDGPVVGAPVVHHVVDALESSLARQPGCEIGRGPRGIGAFVDVLEDRPIDVHGPPFGDLQHRTLAFYQVQAAHRHRHVAAREELRRETAAAHVFAAGRVPGRRFEASFGLLFGDLPEGFHHGVALGVGHRARGVQRAASRVDQVDDAVRGLARQFPARGALYGFGAPIGAYVGEKLRLIGQQVHEEHRNAVQRVVFGGEGVGFADAVPVERRVEDGFREVAVGAEVGPLALALKTAGDGVVSGGLLFEAHFGELRIAHHEVAEDHRHFDHILPHLVFLFARIAEVFRVEVLAFVCLAVLFDPSHSPFELLLVIDAQFDAAGDLRAVHGFVAHAQILLEEIGIGH